MACDQLKTVFINSSRLFSTTPHWSVADILRFSPGSRLERWPCTVSEIIQLNTVDHVVGAPRHFRVLRFPASSFLSASAIRS
ncbi:hypothetical protein T4E_63 [Trichinella pseudospiralis]|uniref:Uncharacterized protein n=1 Tax=Trichinella pseudospiralis TaxID=6337 RepID=A0A0V0YA35_TRIPS|nr:hypothetical protein T4E_63 [Trichinella pseudospiralis]